MLRFERIDKYLPLMQKHIAEIKKYPTQLNALRNLLLSFRVQASVEFFIIQNLLTTIDQN
jgi:hypothetical protein